MSPDRFARLMNVFEAAATLPPPQRAQYVAEACAGDHALAAQVHRMLQADADASSDAPIDRPGAGATLVATSISEPPSPAVDAGSTASRVRQPLPVLSNDYRITRIIGEGGMGTVYEAEQLRPRRLVALKAIRPGLATVRMVRRLLREAEILARLNHPGIARIYEVGAADEDAPEQAFIAMELIRGEPLTRFAEERALDLRDRVELMARICEAVGHAHAAGVVHRDLKPANILVEPDGRPRILDFGVASVDGGLTAYTEAGGLVGTLAYMSPEQVRSEPVDAKADVWALGTLLYRILTGRAPLDLEGLGLTAAARLIESAEPTPIGDIDRRLRGDLQAIVQRAMAIRPGDRYPDASALERDLRRYLDGRPVDAAPARPFAQLLRAARRHARPLLLAASLLAVAVLAVLLGYLLGRANQ